MNKQPTYVIAGQLRRDYLFSPGGSPTAKRSSPNSIQAPSSSSMNRYPAGSATTQMSSSSIPMWWWERCRQRRPSRTSSLLFGTEVLYEPDRAVQIHNPCGPRGVWRHTGCTLSVGPQGALPPLFLCGGDCSYRAHGSRVTHPTKTRRVVKMREPRARRVRPKAGSNRVPRRQTGSPVLPDGRPGHVRRSRQ